MILFQELIYFYILYLKTVRIKLYCPCLVETVTNLNKFKFNAIYLN